MTSEIDAVLGRCGVAGAAVEAIPENHGPEGNGNWHVRAGGRERAVLRRYHADTTLEDLRYEFVLLGHLAERGWCVPAPLGPPVEHGGRWYCLTRWVPGTARSAESRDQQRQRGSDLARLHAELRFVPSTLGQRPGWQPLHAGLPVMTPIDWRRGLDELAADDPSLAGWIEVVAAATTEELRSVAGQELPTSTIHGDFLAGENVHYIGDRLAGVIDFGVAHHGSRVCDLISARTYRQPQVGAGYVEQVGRLGWPLSEAERAAVVPVYRAFRLFMVSWQLDVGVRTGRFDTEAIRSQLVRAAVDQEGNVAQPPGHLTLPR